MSVATTVIKFASNVNQEVSTLQGDISATTVKGIFAEVYPYLANCTSTETVEGTTKTIVFAEAVGTKGN